jgi:phage protein D
MDDMSTAPGFVITVGGTSFKQTDPNGIRSIMVEDHVDMAGQCTLILGCSETDPSWDFKMGDKVDVKLKSSDHSVFMGEVVSLEHSFQIGGTSTLILRCVDGIHKLGRGLKTKLWNEMTDSDVAKQVCSEAGLQAETDSTDEKLPYILQRNETDVAFLKRLAARNNFQLRVEQDKVFFKKADLQSATQEVKMGENLVSLNLGYNSMNQVQKVVVKGWSVKDKKEVVGTYEAKSVTKVGGGKLGSEESSVFGSDVVRYITDIPVGSQKMADKIAEAEMERLARQFCRGKCSIRGNNFIRAGTIVDFSGFSQGLNGKYYVIFSRYSINSRIGYTTEFNFCSNTVGS